MFGISRHFTLVRFLLEGLEKMAVLMNVTVCRYLLVFQTMADSSQASASGPVNVVLLGHSYIRRLRVYARRYCRTNLGLAGVNINFICQGGLTLRPRSRRSPRGGCTRSVQDCLQAVADCCPALILIHIGENDLGHISAGEIVREILLLVTDLSNRCHCPVYVCQLLTWPSHSLERVNDVLDINGELRRMLPPYRFWRYRRGFRSALFLPDRVHLNDSGMSQYLSSIRVLLARAIRHLHH